MILLFIIMNNFEFAVNLVIKSFTNRLSFPSSVINRFNVLLDYHTLTNHFIGQLFLQLPLVLLYHPLHYLSYLLYLLILILIV